MSGKLPWMKFCPGDFMQDTITLSLPATGAWIKILCAMWRQSERGILTLSVMEYCRLLSASETETLAVIDELVKTGVSDTVTDANKNITLICRRMVREHKHHKNNALRQERFRVTHNSNADVTGEKSEVRSQKSEVREDKIAVTVKKPSQPASRIKIVDDEWINSLRPDCEKQGINLDDQLIKIKRWLTTHPGRKFTQRMVVGWLNRCDKTIQGGFGNGNNRTDHRLEKASREYTEDIHAPIIRT